MEAHDREVVKGITVNGITMYPGIRFTSDFEDEKTQKDAKIHVPTHSEKDIKIHAPTRCCRREQALTCVRCNNTCCYLHSWFDDDRAVCLACRWAK